MGLNWNDECALGFEGGFVLVRGAAAGISEGSPFAEHRVRHGGAGRVRRPTGAAGSDHVVLPVALEDGRGFVVVSGKSPHPLVRE